METYLEWGAKTVAILGFAFALYRYWWSQRWKVAEFVASEMKTFFDNPVNRNALWMLDYWERTIDFSEEGDKKPPMKIDRAILRAALTPHNRKERFVGPEIYVRDTFEQFFDSLGQFECFIEAGLVQTRDVRPYLAYWMQLIGGENSLLDRDTCEVIWRYLDFYKYSDIQRLAGRFGYDIRPTSQQRTDPGIASQSAPV